MFKKYFFFFNSRMILAWPFMTYIDEVQKKKNVKIVDVKYVKYA